MPRKPDRFERIVGEYMGTILRTDYSKAILSDVEVIDLLRKEHRWVERMVKGIAQDYESSVGDTAAEMLRDEILAKLKQRRK